MDTMENPEAGKKNKDFVDILQIVLLISAILVGCIYFATGIFSITVSLILVSIVGFIAGIVEKNKKMRIIFSILFVLLLIWSVAFYVLLSYSNM